MSTQATIGDTDHCPACWLDQLPTAAVQPIAVLPPRTQRWWRHARYICPQCSHGWWRPLPAYPDLPPIPERPKRKSNKRRSKEGTS